MKNISVGISGIGSYVPDRVLTNYNLAQMVETNNEWIVERTGIEQRRIADTNQTASDLATQAAIKALEDANTTPEEIDLIIVATATPDHTFPSTASLVQAKLNATKAAAFDMSVGCTGFVYGIATGANFISSGMYKKVLVIGSEVLSKIVNWEDRNTCVLFGDGAGAVVLEACEDGYGILSCELGSDGKEGNVLIVPAGGSKLPASEDTVKDKLHSIQMEGREVFKFAVRIMEKASLVAIEKANLELEDLDFLVPHQANIRIIDSALKKLKLSRDKACINLNKYGNMSSASIPVALDEAVKDGRVRKGDNLVLVAFGAGLTWGSLVIKWNKEGMDD
ncbi:beta-ketoacyl-ACP synthase III [Tissierella sp. Yu-01]|uniref:beta-ketoacyl-ACP synthase III n=1 Tax=Tissierella sp. Yu-01 TaxID=3035694 RepID=UPI00240E5760|nr:beta-ketoacyl-ACP synthase III [Tissierella sp. Yu-01]WFA10299.1 ketoacyl-ACP synthase III [Tissierella sp. Yu-01]